ncbi:hypothetical protein [Marinobacter algicola]|uniref:Tryptophan synthase, alpha chain n=1 Tax=Marinobacter algicola DG893 TaxID=443152 RepID=A6F2P8_9GAMM|nr:hypothetical protein [Marinobacter algicola]EDM46993.1 Tryptophan synthase, alpha chain [Marinobacter algicola DG893]
MWNHRPEYQFSRYSLEIDEINRVQVDPDTGDETSDDIFDTDTPVIGSSGNLVHNTVATRQLEVGKAFDGQLNSLKWFDWTSQPVMTFDDGSVEKTVTVGQDGYTEMTLQSTGAMGAGGSQLMTQRIAVHTDKVRQYASLVSREAFATLAGQYADTLDNSAPPINVAGLDPNYQPVSLPFISKAYAADGESSFLWSLVNWFIPIEDFGIVLDQLGYLVSDPEKFDGMEFTIALVNTVTIFPPAKPLKLFTTPLRALFRSMDKVNPKFAKHFAGYLGKVVQKAKKGDFDTLWNTLPFLVLAAELYSDPDAREGLEFLFSTVDSADDVLAWVNYLGLPANGWEGEGDPPTVPAFGDDPQVSQNLPLGWLVPQAQAAPVASAARITKEVLGDVLLQRGINQRCRWCHDEASRYSGHSQPDQGCQEHPLFHSGRGGDDGIPRIRKLMR